jgi:hypothetical protein
MRSFGDVIASTQRRAASALCILTLFGTGMFGWSMLLAHNLPRAEEVVAAAPEVKNYRVLGADFEEYRDYFRDYPHRFADITSQNSLSEYYKRPAFGPISASLTIILYQLFGIDYQRSMFLILAFYASLAGVMFYVLVRHTKIAPVEALLTTAFCVFSFAWLSTFSVPESYSLAVCATIACLLSGRRFVDGHPITWGSSIRHTIVVGLASWIYLPACGAVLLLLPSLKGRRQILTVLLPCVVLAIVIGVAPHLLNDAESARNQIDYAHKWNSLNHFADPLIVAKVAAAFLFFGFVSPVSDLLQAPPELNIQGVTDTNLVVILTILAVLLTFLVLRGNWRRYSGVAAWFLSVMAFHIYFNPGEVLLYLSPPVTILAYLVVLALSDLHVLGDNRSPTSRLGVISVMALVLVTMAIYNLRVVAGTG